LRKVYKAQECQVEGQSTQFRALGEGFTGNESRSFEQRKQAGHASSISNVIP